jgi:hypothetical protein
LLPPAVELETWEMLKVLRRELLKETTLADLTEGISSTSCSPAVRHTSVTPLVVPAIRESLMYHLLALPPLLVSVGLGISPARKKLLVLTLATGRNAQ